MRLRIFQAPNVAEAMRKVRAELGDDAIIVSTHKNRRGDGVEVTAALDTGPAERAEAPLAPASPLNGKVSSGLAASAETIAKTLAYHGVSGRLVERLCVAAIDGHPPADEPVELRLAEALRVTLRFQPVSITEPKAVILVGPPGVGKTVTTAKILARDVLAGIQAIAITCDTTRAGGVEQLAAFTRVMEVSLTTVETAAELARSVAHAEGRVVIDTAGTNPYDQAEMNHLRELVEASRAEPILVLPAGGDPHEAAEATALFAAIGVHRMIATRLDATRRIGGLLNAADGAHIALADASLTPFVGEGLHPLSPRVLARLLLRNPQHPTDRNAFIEPES